MSSLGSFEPPARLLGVPGAAACTRPPALCGMQDAGVAPVTLGQHPWGRGAAQRVPAAAGLCYPPSPRSFRCNTHLTSPSESWRHSRARTTRFMVPLSPAPRAPSRDGSSRAELPGLPAFIPAYLLTSAFRYHPTQPRLQGFLCLLGQEDVEEFVSLARRSGESRAAHVLGSEIKVLPSDKHPALIAAERGVTHNVSVLGRYRCSSKPAQTFAQNKGARGFFGAGWKTCWTFVCGSSAGPGPSGGRRDGNAGAGAFPGLGLGLAAPLPEPRGSGSPGGSFCFPVSGFWAALCSSSAPSASQSFPILSSRYRSFPYVIHRNPAPAFILF